MLTRSDRELLDEAQDVFGEDLQFWILIEELAEMIHVVCKLQRVENIEEFETVRKLIALEMADVYITLEHLKMFYGITDNEIKMAIKYKLDRLRQRVEEERR